VRQHLEVGHACGVVDRDVDLVIVDAIEASLLSFAGDPVAHLAKASQGFDVDVDQLYSPLPLVALHRNLGLQIPQASKTELAKHPGDGGEGSLQQPGDVPEVQPLVAEIHGVLQLLLLELAPLCKAHAGSICQ